jgi:hypothetical protein
MFSLHKGRDEERPMDQKKNLAQNKKTITECAREISLPGRLDSKGAMCEQNDNVQINIETNRVKHKPAVSTVGRWH